MKKFAEILTDIELTSKILKESEANEKRLESEWMESVDRVTRHAKKKSLESEWSAACENTLNLKLSLNFLRNNARVALYHEVMPVVLEVLEKYKGKPYGEKTRAKIAGEIKEKTGVWAYINTRFNSEEIYIQPQTHHNTYAITVYIKRNSGEDNHLLIDNKIQSLPFDLFRLEGNYGYFEDIPATVAKLKELRGRAVAIRNELKTACDEFNAIAVNGIEHIYHNQNFYDRLF